MKKIILLGIIGVLAMAGVGRAQGIRKAVWAGQFYEAEKARLMKTIDGVSRRGEARRPSVRPKARRAHRAARRVCLFRGDGGRGLQAPPGRRHRRRGHPRPVAPGRIRGLFDLRGGRLRNAARRRRNRPRNRGRPGPRFGIRVHRPGPCRGALGRSPGPLRSARPAQGPDRPGRHGHPERGHDPRPRRSAGEGPEREEGRRHRLDRHVPLPVEVRGERDSTGRRSTSSAGRR